MATIRRVTERATPARRPRAWMALGALIIAIAIGPTIAWRIGSPPQVPAILHLPGASPTAEALVVRILAFNLNHGGRFDAYRDRAAAHAHLDRLAGAIRDARADLVLLSEVDFDVQKSHRLDQAHELAVRAGFPHVVEGVDHELRSPWFSFRAGNALLSRWPVLQAKNHDLPPAGIRRALIGGRRALEAQIALGGLPTSVVVVHLDSSWGGAIRERQAEAITGWLAGPAILGGDLNAVPLGWEDHGQRNDSDRTLAILAGSGLRSIPGDSDRPELRTYPAAAPNGRIDHVLATAPWAVESVQTSSAAGSDHRGILVTLRREVSAR